MRRQRPLVILAIVLAMLFVSAPAVMAEEYELATVTLNGKPLTDSAGNVVPGYIVLGRTMVPFRALFQAFGASVNFVSLDQPITAVRGSQTLSFTIGSSAATLNGQPYTMPVPPMIIDERAMVPVRATEVFGAAFGFDEASRTVTVTEAPKITSGKIHEGKIGAGGETWWAVESPHIVKGDFRVEGLDSPILKIEAGATVRFEKDASLVVGQNAPGGLEIRGTATKKVMLTADSTSPQPGFWSGISFFDQALANASVIEGAVIEYAGTDSEWDGAIHAESETPVEITLKDVEIKNSSVVALNLINNARLSKDSVGLKINNTKAANGKGGYPIQVTALASNSLPIGEYKDNDINAVHVWRDHTIKQDVLWRNIGIPYAIPADSRLEVDNSNAPKLTIEPGTIVVMGKGADIQVADYEQFGTIVADAGVTLDKAALDAGLKNWQNWVNNQKSNIPATNKAIVFAPWSKSPSSGAWNGITLSRGAGKASVFNGVVVAYGGKANDDWSAGIFAEADASEVSFSLTNSLIKSSGTTGVQLAGVNAKFGSCVNNYFEDNTNALRIPANAVYTVDLNNHFGPEDIICIWHDGNVKTTQTWKNLTAPYYVECDIRVGGSGRTGVTLTIEPGVELMFAPDCGLEVGTYDAGTLKAVGTADKVITFTSLGNWRGLDFGDYALKGSAVEHAVVENAGYGISIYSNLGKFIKNTTIRGCNEVAIYGGEQDWEASDLNITFEDNADNVW